MKKFKILNKPTRLEDLQHEDLYQDFSDESELKAERIQVKAYRKFKHQLA